MRIHCFATQRPIARPKRHLLSARYVQFALKFIGKYGKTMIDKIYIKM
jgi:hypothetical protein